MPEPKIGLSMLYCLSEPFSKMLKELKNTQTTLIEIVDEGSHTLNKKRATTLNQIAESHNLSFSVHAPFADINIASLSKPMRTAAMKRLTQSMLHAHTLNAYLWVFHPGNKSGISTFYPGQEWTQNLQSIRELHETAEKLELHIAMENLPEKYNFLMKTPQDFQQFYEETALTDIGIVLDTGHANLEGQIQPFLQQMPSKITHVHVSDNHGENDEHLGLGDGKINWKLFAETLKATGFQGTVITESIFKPQETLQKLKQLLR